MSTILGIGLDLVEIARLETIFERHKTSFLQRTFTTAEQSYCDKQKYALEHYSARWAAKEAVAKAFGTGIGEHCKLLEIEVTHNQLGAPAISLYGNTRHFSQAQGVHEIFVSLSHTRNYATAQVILTKAK